MTDTAALDQAVRENLDQIRRGLAKNTLDSVWQEGVGFLPAYTAALIRVSYRRIATKMANAEEVNNGTVEHIS